VSAGRVVVDTGVVLAAADADDAWHDRAAEVLQARDADRLVLPAPVATEAAWLIGSRLGPATEAAFVASIAAGEFSLVDLTVTDWARCAELIARYGDLDLGLVDASVVAVAERLSITTLASIDRRDLLVVRPAHCDAFELIP
jgi:predicted nucleic acid-binding protein